MERRSLKKNQGFNGIRTPYVSSIERFSETQLPPKSEFYFRLNDEDISDADYQHAPNVWNTFQCQTIRDYHDLYLKSDVLLLADVFENFRATCLKHYSLDPAHHYSSPGLAWDACLKTTGQELQLLHDYDMLMMFERGIRGGITLISRRYAEANIENTSWEVWAYVIYARVVDVSEIERLSAANE